MKTKQLLLTLLAVLSIPLASFADVWQDPETKVNYEYTPGQNDARVTSSSGISGNITILSKFSVDESEYIVTSINVWAFSGCHDLASITIPSSVTSIGNGAFYGCKGLTSIVIPNSVTTIGNSAFDCSGLTSVTIGSSVTSIGEAAFYKCSRLTSITIPNSVTSIGDYAFSDCSGLTSVKVGSGNKVYDSRNDCNAIIKTETNELITGCKKTVIPNSVTSIGWGAFSGCSGLSSVTIPNSVTSIGDYAFSDCSGLSSITIPNSVTNIGGGAFLNCTGLTSVTIPSNVTTIGDYAFQNCSKLSTVISHIQDPFTVNDNVFETYDTATLCVPNGTKEKYAATSPWSIFSTIEEIEADESNPSPKFVAQTMILHHPGGTITEVDMGTKPVMHFHDDKVVVSTKSSKSEYPKDEILSITYYCLNTDVNGDGAIDVADIATIIDFMAGNAAIARDEADVNGDGAVDVADIATLISTMADLSRREKVSTQEKPATTDSTIGEAFYIYRNDGQFNAFFRQEIDSIDFSRYDGGGLRHNKIVSQVVYTPDSTYMIPLTAIDSVGFVQPETIVSDDVFPLTAEHSPYISDADTLKFTMSASTPEALRPKVGNIVVATADCDAFPDGIVARVKSVANTASGYLYQCSIATLEDVFDQLVLYSKSVESIDGASASRGLDLRKATLNAELWNLNWSRTIEGGGTTTTLSVGDQATVTVTARKTLTTPFFLQVELQNTLSADIDFKAKSSVGHFEQRQIGNTLSVGRITIPGTGGFFWLTPKISLYGYFQEEGKVELNYSGFFNRTDRLGFTYTEGNWSFYHDPTTNAGTDVAQLSMEGYAEVGLRPQIDFSLNGRKAGFGCSVSVGLKEYINFLFDMTKLSNGGLYDAMRDSYCRTTIPWSVTAHASADIFSRYDSDFSDVGFATFSHTFEPREEPQLGPDRYIFPLFGDVEGQRQGTKVMAKAGTSRTTLLPIQVGFSLLDKDKNIVQTVYDRRIYRNGNAFGNYSCVLSGLEGTDKYTVRPSVKLFGKDVLASPEAEVKEGDTSCPDSNHPHWIDLGLPSGTQWCCCNVGASTPEEYGNYYNYYGAQAYNPPSLGQIEELLENTRCEFTTLNGVYCTKITGSNGGVLFIPNTEYIWSRGWGAVKGKLFGWNIYSEENSCPVALYVGGGGLIPMTDGDAYPSSRHVRPVR